MVRCFHTSPWNNGLRRPPAQLADWWRGERYAAIQSHAGHPLDRRCSGDRTTCYVDRLRQMVCRSCRLRDRRRSQEDAGGQQKAYTAGLARTTLRELYPLPHCKITLDGAVLI